MADNERKKSLRRPPRPKGKRSVAAPAGSASSKRWRRVADRLEMQIAAGRFRPAGNLPAEATLAAELGTSRHTLRLAIRELIRRGLLRSVPYRGTFVAPSRIEFKIGPSSRLLDAIASAGFTPDTQVLSRRHCVPPEAIAQRLGVAKRTEVLEIVSLVTANALPLCCTTVWMPADRFGRVGEIFEVTKSLRRAFAQIGVIGYRRRLIRITSRVADKAECHRLNLSKGSILIGFDGVCIDSSGEPTYAFDNHFNAARISFVVEM